MPTVLWDKGERREKDNRMVYPTICECGYSRLLTKTDATKASECFYCSQKRKAKKGFQAMVKLWGEKWAIRHVQAYRLLHRTPQENIVTNWLRDKGFSVTEEFKLATKTKGRKQHVYLIDVMVYMGGVYYAIEINGGCHVNHVRRDKRKRSLLKRRQYPLKELTNEQVESGEYIQILTDFLNVQNDIMPVKRLPVYYDHGYDDFGYSEAQY